MTQPQIEDLRNDYILLTDILKMRRAVPTKHMNAGVFILWNIYLNILDDALSTLKSLIEYFSRHP